MSAPEIPQQSDGKVALRNPTLRCFNILNGASPRKYHYIDDSIKIGAGVDTDHDLENEGEPLGGYVTAGRTKGTISMQYDLVSDTDIIPAFVMGLNKGSGEEFFVVTDGGESAKRNDIKRAKLAVKKIYNPVSLTFQGPLGNYFSQAFSKAGGDKTFDAAFANFRAGAAKAYTATLSDGSALPADIVINAGTGIITVTAASVAIGVYEIEVTVKDTVSGQRDRYGIATIALTVAA